MAKKELSSVEFTTMAILKLRTEGYKGCHTVYSGFNSAYRKYFDADPIKACNAMHKEGTIFMHPTKGGAMIYVPSDKPAEGSADKALKAMGL